jgi:predicted nucleic acid-binding protein
VYLVDTDVISERRKRDRADSGVAEFFRKVRNENTLYISAVTVGELCRGVEVVGYRGDRAQAARLAEWLSGVVLEFADRILPLDTVTAQIWGKLRVPHEENALDKQIAATALIHDLTLVTRNQRHFEGLGVRVLNPFRSPLR